MAGDDDSRGQPSRHYGGKHFNRDEISLQLTELARTLHEERDSDEVLKNVVLAALELIPGVDEGSISVVFDRKTVASRAPSGELPAIVDGLQTRIGQGPCLEAAYEERTVRVPDMSTEQRWPVFAAQASEAGVGSMLAFQLFVDKKNLGALNLYSRHANAFTDESEHIGLMVAAHAALAYAEANEVEQLTESVSTRDRIGQAKGILMERYKITDQQAFMLLAQVSQGTNTKLAAIADVLASTGELPGPKAN
ncbi:GAF and ANTAR domain-containing protein [Arthrobacter castelli]|uniref:GAF and ANTAR domain-containing protein n=1 Tax=Arthrobacter castelli TaxID=271431 RepID=UPI001FDFDE71|nr:GAF and ANTAR domain-containing protein [Arthrobacter castelli]